MSRHAPTPAEVSTRPHGFLGIAVALWMLLAGGASARDSGATLSIPWWTVDGGGGSSTGGVHRITGTIGQWDATAMTMTAGTTTGLAGGFWPLADAPEPAPPEIQGQPASPPPVAAGECITLFVEATGSPLPRYQWRRNGIQLQGATNPVLELCLTNETVAAAYDVLVFNDLGFVRSNPAVVGRQLDPLPSSPDFFARGVVTGLHGQGGGSNTDGRRIPGEPLHDGRRGGKTVWITYHAPATGVLTLDTRGSAFDTLLAIYQGTDPKNLVPVASDDDGGGYYRSLLRCRVIGGLDYAVAIDGRAGATGRYELNWDLLVTDVVPPRFVRQPAPTTVRLGGRATFTAAVDNATLLQWLHNGVAIKDDGRITGARTPVLSIDNARVEDAGSYRLVALVGAIRIDGEIATLHLDLSPAGTPGISGAAAFDKFADARDDILPPSSGSSRAARASRGQPGGLARGGPLLTRTDDFGTSTHETALCGVPSGASAWFYYQAETNGLVVLDTTGSSYDTVAGAFVDLTGDPDAIASTGCNDDASEGTATSRMIFNANADLLYAVVVAGKEGAGGTLVAQVRPVGQPRLTAGGFAAGDTFTVAATAEPNLRLVLEYTASLAAGWTPLQTNTVPSTGSTEYLLAAGGANALYFRAKPDFSEYPMISTPP